MYRAACATCSRPVIPYLGVYLSDVTFIHQGNPDIIPYASLAATGNVLTAPGADGPEPIILFSKVRCL